MKFNTFIFTYILVMLLFIGNAISQDFEVKYGVKGGILKMEEPWDKGFYGSLIAGIPLSQQLEFVIPISYWISRYESYGLNIILKNLKISSDIQFYPLQNVGLFFGGGLNYNLFRFDVPIYDWETDTWYVFDVAEEKKFGFSVLGGYRIQIGGMDGFLSVKYNFIKDFNTLEIGLGVLLEKP